MIARHHLWEKKSGNRLSPKCLSASFINYVSVLISTLIDYIVHKLSLSREFLWVLHFIIEWSISKIQANNFFKACKVLNIDQKSFNEGRPQHQVSNLFRQSVISLNDMLINSLSIQWTLFQSFSDSGGNRRNFQSCRNKIAEAADCSLSDENC